MWIPPPTPLIWRNAICYMVVNILLIVMFDSLLCHIYTLDTVFQPKTYLWAPNNNTCNPSNHMYLSYFAGTGLILPWLTKLFGWIHLLKLLLCTITQGGKPTPYEIVKETIDFLKRAHSNWLLVFVIIFIVLVRKE